MSQDEYIPCKLCGEPTRFHGTKMCNGCWELDSRIRADVPLTKKILRAIAKEEGKNYIVEMAKED